ncbi:7-carboxy-7-deazaguanine synthase QueE [Candidatus Dojkabacteria bacterium]|uniref:7-carboxy-7-deazaguanine synthase n=1 Tax=Candidatus Dojkabacteria bacterium TaxID=2099670 RepID=A0A3M0YZS0_9BACT|nr:MAG: 7-carboxy-7-deazaguanine synthase QueE [Candidatus Dojkabacteria bacterium]
MSVNIYKPTTEDRERIKHQFDKLKISGDGVFATLQGEGQTTGKPAVFLRLHFCNLHCSWCDTRYTWDKNSREFWQEPEDWSYGETAVRINNAWESVFPTNQEKRLVITGGEPLLQQRKIVNLLQRLPGWEIEIETNGTIMPIPELYTCQFNCSPKLENSGNPLQIRYKPEVLRVINNLSKSQFKFVVTKPLDLDEIDLIVSNCNLNPTKILIMPEGQTKKEVEIRYQMIKDAVEARGWGITLRNQLIWFGSKRRT